MKNKKLEIIRENAVTFSNQPLP